MPIQRFERSGLDNRTHRRFVGREGDCPDFGDRRTFVGGSERTQPAVLLRRSFRPLALQPQELRPRSLARRLRKQRNQRFLESQKLLGRLVGRTRLLQTCQRKRKMRN